MAAVTLDEAKRHLRVSYDDEDAEISEMIETAEMLVNGQGVSTADPCPAPVRHALLLWIGHMFRNREATTAEDLRPLAYGVDALIAPFREMTF